MLKTPINVALILAINSTTILFEMGLNDIINLINKQFPNNLVIIDKYLTNNTKEELELIVNDFISKYPSGNRVFICAFTSILKFITEYLNSLGLNIPSISFASTSPAVRTFKNALTYAPIDKYSAMSQFLIYKDYKMEQIKILFQPNSSNDIFFQTYLEEVKIQANLLDIKYDIEFLDVNKNFYNILPKSVIIMLAETDFLNSFVNSDFLNSIPPECYITLSDFNDDIGDIFGHIPTIVFTPFPIDFTETSTLVYNSLTDKKTNFYFVYIFYDILYSLVFFTNTNLSLTLENYVKVNPFQSGVFPAFIGTQSNLDLRINGIEFGSYSAIFTKNSIVQNDNLLYLTYNRGGTTTLPESNSVFKILGIVPFFNINILYGDEDYYKIYDECGNLILTRFTSNITEYPFKKNTLINIGQHCNNKFYCKYTSNKYFSYLESVSDAFNNNSIVNLTMGKKPFLKVINKN